jgi:hypothetical protein
MDPSFENIIDLPLVSLDPSRVLQNTLGTSRSFQNFLDLLVPSKHCKSFSFLSENSRYFLFLPKHSQGLSRAHQKILVLPTCFRASSRNRNIKEQKKKKYTNGMLVYEIIYKNFSNYILLICSYYNMPGSFKVKHQPILFISALFLVPD